MKLNGYSIKEMLMECRTAISNGQISKKPNGDLVYKQWFGKAFLKAIDKALKENLDNE